MGLDALSSACGNPPMNLPQLQSFAAANPAASRKFDPYLLAALKTSFVEYALGGHANPTLSIGFTVACQAQPPFDDAGSVELALQTRFSADATTRLTDAHLTGLAATGTAHLTADVSFELLATLAQLPFVTGIQLCADLSPRRAAPRRSAGLAAGLPEMPPYRSTNQKVLALIDHGCPFAHRAFLKGLSTRVVALWDQDHQPDFLAADGSTPRGYGYGRQLDQQTLNAYIAQARIAGEIDESACYQAAQYPALRSRFTHGSLTMGLLAGQWLTPSLSASGRSESRPEDADIVFVQLPRTIPVAPARGCIERSSLDGVRYALDCAPDGAQVGIVIDYGTEMGPHDGSSWFETALDALVVEALQTRNVRLEVVFPSGNSYISRRHALISGAQARVSPPQLGWWIAKGNDSPATLEIWMQTEDAQFTLDILPPGNGPVLTLQGDQDAVQCWPLGGAALLSVVNKPMLNQRVILLQVGPTQGGDGEPNAPSGVWQLTFKPLNGKGRGKGFGVLHAYTCWGGQNPGMPQRVRAGVLLARPDQSAQVAIDGDGSLLGSGCGTQVWMAGGHEQWGKRSWAEYSSGGQARGGKRAASASAGADVCLPTEQLPSLPGLLCLGTRSASRVRARGTSFAAPQLARAILQPGFVWPPLTPVLAPPHPGSVAAKSRNRKSGEPRL